MIVFAPWSEPSGNGLPPAIARIVRLVERPLQARLANLLLESLPTFPPQQTMRLAARCEAIDFRTKGIDNNAFQLSDQLGNHVLLSLVSRRRLSILQPARGRIDARPHALAGSESRSHCGVHRKLLAAAPLCVPTPASVHDAGRSSTGALPSVRYPALGLSRVESAGVQLRVPGAHDQSSGQTGSTRW